MRASEVTNQLSAPECPVGGASTAVFRVALLLVIGMLGAYAWAATSAGQSWRLATLLIIAPILEESIFRAGLQDRLIRCRVQPWLCVLCTAIAFAIVHMMVWQQWAAAILLLPGLALGVVYQFSRSVLWCAALHAGMNALWLLTPSLR